jgi:hypothetical protein
VGTDLFAVAAIIVFALQGRVPFAGEDGRAILAAQLAGRADLAELDDSLVRWLRRALAADPAQRFRDAEDMRAGWRVVVRRVLREERLATSPWWRLLRRLGALFGGRGPMRRPIPPARR